MINLHFIGQIFYFAVNILAALAFFSIFLLYIDAWLASKSRKEWLKWLGCLFISLSFVMLAVSGEGSVENFNIGQLFGLVVQGVGYLVLIYGQIIDPLQQVPLNGDILFHRVQHTAESTKKDESIISSKHSLFAFGAMQAGFLAAPTYMILKIGIPILSLFVAFLYLRRATIGLERHLKPVALGFLLIFVANLVSLSDLVGHTNNPFILGVISPYGWLWWVNQLIIVAGVIVLARWVWKYLSKRIFSQIFMIFTTMSAAIFLLITGSFTYLLINSIQKDTLNTLENASNSINLALDNQNQRLISHAELVAQKPNVLNFVKTKDNKSLTEIVDPVFQSYDLSSLIITSSAGQVLYRAEDSSRWGDSLSDSEIVKKALSGERSIGALTREGVIAPNLTFYAGVPIKGENGNVSGVVLAGIEANSAFVSNIKQATGMDVSVYSDNRRTATTLLSADGKTHLVGVEENNNRVKERVLKERQTYRGSTTEQNQPYLAVFSPLKSADNESIGMLQVGLPYSYIANTAASSIRYTFIASAFALVISTIPTYLLAKRIEGEVK